MQLQGQVVSLSSRASDRRGSFGSFGSLNVTRCHLIRIYAAGEVRHIISYYYYISIVSTWKRHKVSVTVRVKVGLVRMSCHSVIFKSSDISYLVVWLKSITTPWVYITTIEDMIVTWRGINIETVFSFKSPSQGELEMCSYVAHTTSLQLSEYLGRLSYWLCCEFHMNVDVRESLERRTCKPLGVCSIVVAYC